MRAYRTIRSQRLRRGQQAALMPGFLALERLVDSRGPNAVVMKVRPVVSAGAIPPSTWDKHLTEAGCRVQSYHDLGREPLGVSRLIDGPFEWSPLEPDSGLHLLLEVTNERRPR